jgi:Protein of unknown function (DUF1449)
LLKSGTNQTDSPDVFELYQAATSSHQLLLTLLLVLVLVYWLSVILGALDIDTDIPDDLTASDGQTDHGINTGGIWITAGRFIGFAQVPIAVWLSFMVLFMWFMSLVLNQFWNPTSSSLQAVILLLPNAIVSISATKIITWPLAKIFKAMSDGDTEAEDVIGRVGIICSMEADEKYGQLEITANGAPLLINVRVQAGATSLVKGQKAKVISAGPDNIYYLIESL